MRNRCLIFDDAERKLGVDEYEQQKRISGEDALALYGYSRKHAIKALNKSGPLRALKRSEPNPRYDATVREVLQRFWLESYQLCGTRLKAALPEWLPHYGSEYGVLDGVLEGKWATISAASIDPLLQSGRAQPTAEGARWNQAGTLAENQIPLKTDNGTSSGLVYGSRHGGPLRWQSGRRLHLEPVFYRSGERLDRVLPPLNGLYRELWAPYHNHFCPSVKLLEKRREGARQIKRHDRAKLLTNASWRAACSNLPGASLWSENMPCSIPSTQTPDPSGVARNPATGSRRHGIPNPI